VGSRCLAYLYPRAPLDAPLSWSDSGTDLRGYNAGRQGAERRRLLHTVIVGGGPTGVEFAGELSDFISKDLAKVDNDRARDMRCAGFLSFLCCTCAELKVC